MLEVLTFILVLVLVVESPQSMRRISSISTKARKLFS